MSEIIHGQVIFLLVTLCNGMALMLFYEILRFLRWFFRHGNISIWIEDILYWGIVSIPTFYIFFIYNDGNIRWYGILMLLTGAFLYEMGISRPIRKILVKIFGKHRPYLLKKLIRKIKAKVRKNKKDKKDGEDKEDKEEKKDITE